jgi:hypothetical protein
MSWTTRAAVVRRAASDELISALVAIVAASTAAATHTNLCIKHLSVGQMQEGIQV